MNTKPIKSKYTEAIVPVKEIKNGMIILDNNEKVTGVKIMPRNIFIADYETQNAIINNLKNVYNIIDYEFWIIAADRPVDINLFLSQLQLLYNSTQDQVKKKIKLIHSWIIILLIQNTFYYLKKKIQIQ